MQFDPEWNFWQHWDRVKSNSSNKDSLIQFKVIHNLTCLLPPNERLRESKVPFCVCNNHLVFSVVLVSFLMLRLLINSGRG